MDSSEPWYLTVVHARGVLPLRPEKSWRPIVSVLLEETGHTHETHLGCDGQNPNMKIPMLLRDVSHTTNLDIRIWHKAPTKKQKRKRHLVASAYVLLGDLVKRQDGPDSDIILNLKCPPLKRRSPNVNSRTANTATLIIRLRAPLMEGPSGSSRSTASMSWPSSDAEDLPLGALSDASDLDFAQEIKTGIPGDVLDDLNTSSLRRRKPRKEKLRPFCVNSCDEDEDSYDDDSCPPTPPLEEDRSSFSYDPDMDTTFEPDMLHCIESTDSPCMPNILPQYAGDTPQPEEDERPLSLMEALVDRFAPYREMSHPECDFGKVLGRLLTEWYAIGASLLATAALNAAVYGYSAPTLVEIDGLALRAVTVGSIASGIGLVADVWFLVFYSGADVAKFQRLAKDVYNTYFFFCLTCRLPTLCLFVAVCSLLLFLLVVAWSAWRTAVLVMCCAAGVLLTLQYLVYGCHRMVNFCVWTVRRVVSAVRGVFTSPQANVAVPMANTAAPRTTTTSS